MCAISFLRHLTQQGRCRCFSSRAGDPNGFAWHNFHKNLRVIGNRNIPFEGLLYDGQCQRHAAGETKHIDVIQQLQRMPTDSPLYVRICERRPGGGQCFRRTRVTQGHVCAVTQKPARKGMPVRSFLENTPVAPSSLCKGGIIIMKGSRRKRWSSPILCSMRWVLLP